MYFLKMSESEIKTLLFYMKKAKIDAEGLGAIGFKNKETVRNIKSIIDKAKDPETHDWDNIIEILENSERHTGRFEISSDGEILCRTEDDAECIADFLEALGWDVIHTSCNDDAYWSWRVYPD